jgi:hypothetical protein
MSETEKTETQSVEEFLRIEVWESRVRIKMAVDYYGIIAKRRTLWMRLIQCVSLLTSSSAIYTAFSLWPKRTIVLAVISAVGSAVSIASGWQAQAVRFLDAQGRARSLETKWDDLWIRVNVADFNAGSVVQEIEILKKEYSEIEQHTQPHYPSKRLLEKIQKRIEEGLGV